MVFIERYLATGLLALSWMACTDPTSTSTAAMPDASNESPAPVPEVGGGTPEPGSSTTASPTPTPSAAVCPDGVLLCDDFEAESPGQNPNTGLWSVIKQNSNESVTVDNNRFFSGRQSVHIHTTNNGYEQAMLVNTSIFPTADNTVFGRMYMYFAGNQPQTHFNLVTAWGALQGQSAATYVNYGGQYDMFLANYYNANNPASVLDLWQHAGVDTSGSYTDTTAMPTNRWACLEWEFRGDNNEMHLWLDNNAIATMTLVGFATECCRSTVWAFPSFRNMAVGWTLVGNQEPFDHFDLWLDAVAFDNKRIGCL